MRGAMLRRARHWIANRGWGGFGREIGRRLRLAARRETARELPDAGLAVHPFDRRYGVDTGGLIWGEQIRWGDALRTEAEREGAFWATGYYGIAPSVFWAMLDALGLDWERHNFVDIGCGKGRALLLALRHPFRSALGIELSPELAGVAQQNLEQLAAPWRQRVPVRAVVGDATSFAVPDGPLLVYLYHPFAAPVMRAFLDHLRRSRTWEPGELCLLYVNPELDGLVMTELPGVERLWERPFSLSAEDAAADRFGSHDEHAVAYRWPAGRLS